MNDWKTVTLDKFQDELLPITPIEILCGECYYEISQTDFFDTSRKHEKHFVRYRKEEGVMKVIQVRENKTYL